MEALGVRRAGEVVSKHPEQLIAAFQFVGRDELRAIVREEIRAAMIDARAAPSVCGENHEVLQKLDGISAELKSLKRASKPPKRIHSQREAVKLLGTSRRVLTILIATKQVKTVEVNGVEKIPATEVDRLSAEGWDVDRPLPPTKKKPTTGVAVASPGAEILKFKL